MLGVQFCGSNSIVFSRTFVLTTGEDAIGLPKIISNGFDRHTQSRSASATLGMLFVLTSS